MVLILLINQYWNSDIPSLHMYLSIYKPQGWLLFFFYPLVFWQPSSRVNSQKNMILFSFQSSIFFKVSDFFLSVWLQYSGLAIWIKSSFYFFLFSSPSGSLGWNRDNIWAHNGQLTWHINTPQFFDPYGITLMTWEETKAITELYKRRMWTESVTPDSTVWVSRLMHERWQPCKVLAVSPHNFTWAKADEWPLLILHDFV